MKSSPISCIYSLFFLFLSLQLLPNYWSNFFYLYNNFVWMILKMIKFQILNFKSSFLNIWLINFLLKFLFIILICINKYIGLKLYKSLMNRYHQFFIPKMNLDSNNFLNECKSQNSKMYTYFWNFFNPEKSHKLVIYNLLITNDLQLNLSKDSQELILNNLLKSSTCLNTLECTWGKYLIQNK